MSGGGELKPNPESMSERARTWLKSKPSLAEVKKAIVAVVAKAEAAGGDKKESRITADVLTEYFVELGGDLDELPMLMDEQPKLQAAQSQSSQLDLSPLCPDGPASAPLSGEEKHQIFLDLQRQFGRRGAGR
ncbi:hypothetical protein ACQYZY_26965 [Pseudomonas aeruginosa]|jgi:hypothetical protein|uniref:hypothetical protein n=1 Tax=Pseudomonas aeruginosa TaxID=287 RepID=UPI001A3320AD|nr:hypothetical protein [Pseudomonas aeruginosa]EKV0397876.1 hypothetical protein [Pseudomonas aeruginosa]EKV3012857.1 hypothetical protein [Pseudomonas aeruginosa]MBH4318542.1 hypothetical protein [Pseudomonas aeruginosa]MBH8701103.1 hypothetical protein [Pseudomonas aeruginosa]WBM10786.1 hypothetical protein M1V28_32715 [Pseudomonas aeruginosa]